jgi:hypothetical protein
MDVERACMHAAFFWQAEVPPGHQAWSGEPPGFEVACLVGRFPDPCVHTVEPFLFPLPARDGKQHAVLSFRNSFERTFNQWRTARVCYTPS